MFSIIYTDTTKRVPGLPQAIITVNNEQTTRQQDGYIHWSQAVANTNSAAYPSVSILAVLQGAGTNGADIVATETGRVFVAESPELFTYDLDGNLLTDGRWTNTWDGENRLIRVETRSDLPGEVPRVRADFTYDGQGRRIAEERFAHDGTNWVSTASTRFLYDGWLLLAEVDDSGAFTRTYTWGLDLSGSMQGAGGVGGLLALHQGGNDYAYAYDGNGNVIALISTDGTTSAHFEFSPFGEQLRATGPAANANRFRFSTKWEDQDTGWLYYGYRWMDPGTGRWLNRDPIEERGGINLYSAFLNDAVNLVDPDGQAVIHVVIAVGADAGISYISGMIIEAYVDASRGLERRAVESLIRLNNASPDPITQMHPCRGIIRRPVSGRLSVRTIDRIPIIMPGFSISTSSENIYWWVDRHDRETVNVYRWAVATVYNESTGEENTERSLIDSWTFVNNLTCCH